MDTGGQLPLAGVRILVGRAKHQAGALSERLRELGADVLEIPFIEIRRPTSYEPLDTALKNIGSYDWLILTSVNGVDVFWERLQKAQIRAQSLQHLLIAAIGPATKKAIEKRGLQVNVIPDEYVAESVVEKLKDKIPGKRVLLARAKVARDVIPNELQKLGAEIDVIEAYETVLPENSKGELQSVLADEKRRPDIVPFTSSSMVRNFLALSGKAKLDGIRFASIGPVTSSTLREAGLAVDIEAQEYTIPGLVRAIANACKRNQEASSSR